MKHIFLLAVLIVMSGIVLPANASDQTLEQRARAAFRMILEQADTNKDGKLSSKECMAIYNDKNMAEKNCTFWDTDKDGTITEDEYAQKASSFGAKKQ